MLYLSSSCFVLFCFVFSLFFSRFFVSLLCDFFFVSLFFGKKKVSKRARAKKVVLLLRLVAVHIKYLDSILPLVYYYGILYDCSTFNMPTSYQ